MVGVCDEADKIYAWGLRLLRIDPNLVAHARQEIAAAKAGDFEQLANLSHERRLRHETQKRAATAVDETQKRAATAVAPAAFFFAAVAAPSAATLELINAPQ